MAISALQQDSEARIASYRKLYEETTQRGEKAKWKKALEEETKNLAMIIRVERLNREGILNGWMEQFRLKHRSTDIVAV